jgi:DNA-binding NarL/FixJ family response regulator
LTLLPNRAPAGASPEPAEAVILVVDDDDLIRTLFRNALTGQPGVRVVGAADGEEGLLRAWQLRPELVLVDLLMPRLDGATFCRVLRANPAGARARVVGVSGADPRGERARALREHCVAWLAKPFDAGELPRLVRAWLAGPAATPPVRASSAWAPLTAREREVAILVAQGRPNRGIAEGLVLAEGTAANHVRRILLRLGLASRTQLAVWVAADPQRRAEAGLG